MQPVKMMADNKSLVEGRGDPEECLIFNFFFFSLTAQMKTLKSVLQLWRVSEE